MRPQSAIYPLLHLKLTITKLAKVHADSPIFLLVGIRINREFLVVELAMAGEGTRSFVGGSASERALHYVSPGDVITADTGFMRCLQ